MVEERSGPENPGIIDQDVNAPEGLNGSINYFFCYFFLTNRPGHRPNTLSAGIEFPGRFPKDGFTASIDDDLGAFCQERASGFFSNTGASTSDDYDFILVFHFSIFLIFSF